MTGKRRSASTGRVIRRRVKPNTRGDVKWSPYTGELEKPIVGFDPPAFWGAVTHERLEKHRRDCEIHQRKVERRVRQILGDKLAVLFGHFEIEGADFEALAWKLAFRHVPGFAVKRDERAKGGRKRRWDVGRLQALHDSVQKAKAKGNLNDRQALKYVSNDPHFKPPQTYRGTQKQWIETLESRLQDAKRHIKLSEGALQSLMEVKASVLKKQFRKP